jgi:hypothetical protein
MKREEEDEMSVSFSVYEEDGEEEKEAEAEAGSTQLNPADTTDWMGVLPLRNIHDIYHTPTQHRWRRRWTSNV